MEAISEPFTLVDRVGQLLQGCRLEVMAVFGGDACEVLQEGRVIAVILRRGAEPETLQLSHRRYNISVTAILYEGDEYLMREIGRALW